MLVGGVRESGGSERLPQRIEDVSDDLVASTVPSKTNTRELALIEEDAKRRDSMAMRMSVRQRSQYATDTLDPHVAAKFRDCSPPTKLLLVHRTKRQFSRSPRSSSMGENPYTQLSVRSRSLIFLLFAMLVASLLLCSIFTLHSSVVLYPWVITGAILDHPPNNFMLRRTFAQDQMSIRFHPRVMYMEGVWGQGNLAPRRLLDDSDFAVNLLPDNDAWQSPQEHCIAKAAWQEQSFPNCNSIHEINVAVSAAEDAVDEDSLSILGEGWFRTTWRLDRIAPVKESVVLKTLRIEREYLSEYYELHRRDAVAMERLTASRFVVDIFGFCGQSAINELANFPFKGIQSLESFNRRMRGSDPTKASAIKLRMAASIALGLADIHAAGSTDPDDENIYMTHYDMNPRNIALFAGGRPKINDFNIAEFLRYNPETNETCKFPSRLHEPWWRAPEEMNTTHTVLVDEKVDVYALGNILFHTLTTHSGRGKQHKDRMNEVRPIVAAGIRPDIPESYTESKDPNVAAIIKAIDLCWAKDPAERASAEIVAAILYQALLNATDPTTTVEEKEVDVEKTPADPSQDDDESSDGIVEDKDAMGHTLPEVV